MPAQKTIWTFSRVKEESFMRAPFKIGAVILIVGSLLAVAAFAVAAARGLLGPVDKPRPDADASEQDESHEAGGELVIPGGDAPLLLEMANEALNP